MGELGASEWDPLLIVKWECSKRGRRVSLGLVKVKSKQRNEITNILVFQKKKKKNHDSCLFLLLHECFPRFLPIFSQIYFILSLMASIIIKLPLLKGNFNNNQGIIIFWSPDYQTHTTSSLILIQQNSFIIHHFFIQILTEPIKINIS